MTSCDIRSFQLSAVFEWTVFLWLLFDQVEEVDDLFVLAQMMIMFVCITWKSIQSSIQTQMPNMSTRRPMSQTSPEDVSDSRATKWPKNNVWTLNVQVKKEEEKIWKIPIICKGQAPVLMEAPGMASVPATKTEVVHIVLFK